MQTVNSCFVCGSRKADFLFSKASARGEFFSLYKCNGCGLEFLSEFESADLKQYYGKEYFGKRTDRGYNNYLSQETEKEIERVFTLNLNDLNFFKFEEKTGMHKSCLDIGCAAGYFVRYMKNRGWDSCGIDVSGYCVEHAVGQGLDVAEGDFLEYNFNRKFDLVTLWATIEHLGNPHLFIEKIHTILKDNGRLYISTCRADGINFRKFKKQNWRYYNFPEHIYFFSKSNLSVLLEKYGFYVGSYFTYGSDFGKSGTLIRRYADFFAKKCSIGDMMVISACKQ